MNRTRTFLCALGLAGLASVATQAASVETQGFLKYEVWFPGLRGVVTDATLATLQGDPNYWANTPDATSYVAGWNSRFVFPDDSHQGYGDRITGWITPTVTGDYDFFIRSDDASELWISTDTTAANLTLVAQETGCCNAFLEPGATQTTATPLHLVAGQKYYVQSLHEEGTGNDYVEVAWRATTDTTPAASLTSIVGMVLSSTADNTGASVTITQQPQAVSVSENTPVTFTVAATTTTPFDQYTGTGSDSNPAAVQGGTAPLGTTNALPAFYQWFTNGVPVAGANGTNLTIAWPKKASDGNKMVKCYVAVPGASTYSSEVKLTLTDDTTPPAVAKVSTDITYTNVLVTFSEPVTDTALAAANYSMDQGITVSSVSRVDLQTVKLVTSKMTENMTYNLTINNVQDTATPANNIAADTKVQVRSFVFMAGTILHKKYDNCNDSYTLDNFFADPRYPNDPDRQDLETMWEYPPGNVGRVAADPVRNYMDTLEGYFIPPTTGNYVFYICGDDEFYLFLSTDDNPANLCEICAEPGGWSDNRAWASTATSAGYHSGTAENWVSATFTPGTTYPQWPTLNTINLTQGKRYYMLSLHHDHSWSGGDWHGVTYKMDTDPDPVAGDASKLTGSVIGYYFDPSGASVNFTQQPQNATVIEGATATFSVAATGTSVYGTTVFYQWQSAPKGSSTWTDIANATTTSFSTGLLALSDDGTQYRVVATVPPINVTSDVATVSVVKDTIPPVATVGAMMDPNAAGTVDVGVTFNKPVTDASAGALANYSISSGTITGLTVYTNRFTADSQNPLVKIKKQSVLLKVTGLSGSGTLTVKNITDTLGNTLTSTNVVFTVDTQMSWGVVGANTLGGVNAVVPVAANGFDVYSDGTAEWGNYDETTFVYQKVTGDFDKKLRVEYQDGSSQWARAGLIVRENTNVFGMDAATQEGSQPGNTPVAPYDGLAGRYQKCHVNPVGATLTGPGNPGNASWEGNRRLDVGGGCTSALTGANAIPQYPNAWCRIQRVGQKFTIYRSDDGVNWVNLGSTTWGVDDESKTPMPDTVYVGPEFSPENGNVTQVADQGSFLARFRDYGDYVAVVNPNLTVLMDASGKVTITWAAGTLVSSPTVKGTYTPVNGATSPYVVTPSAGTMMFYQIQQ